MYAVGPRVGTDSERGVGLYPVELGVGCVCVHSVWLSSMWWSSKCRLASCVSLTLGSWLSPLLLSRWAR